MASHQCWDCGRSVDEHEIARRNVHTSFWGYRRVNMCPTCAAKWRRVNRGRRLIGLAVLVIVIVGLYAANRATQTSTTTGAGAEAKVTTTTAPTPRIRALPVCSPAPCVRYQGLTLSLSDVNPDFAAGQLGHHLARITFTFTDRSGDHTVNPLTDFTLRDVVKGDATPNWRTGGNMWSGENDWPTGCAYPTTNWNLNIAPTGTAGPYGVCFEMAGPPNQPLLLKWTPEPLTQETCFGTTIPKAIGSIASAPPTGELLTDPATHCSVVLLGLPSS